MSSKSLYTFLNASVSRLLIISVLILVSSHQALAGSGTFDAGAFNFCVSIRFNATNAQITEMQQAFQKGSDVLLDATDGQHWFGTVNFVNNSGASNNAEYWINQASGRAYATYGKYGTRGEHVNLYYPDNISGGGTDGNAYTVAHESVHHFYGNADEYSGRKVLANGTIGTGDAECAAAESATLNYSLMDNYFSRGGNFGAGTTYTLNELCITTTGANAVDNHDPDNDTYQQSINGESAWETVAKSPYAITMPAGLPTDAAPASKAVTFNTVSAGLRALLVLDRSGSMSGDRIALLKSAGKIFVNALNVGDAIGIASFSSTASLDYALTTITGATEKTAAKAAIDSLIASGSTNIGGGMQEGLTALQAALGCADIMIVLSDGAHNTGTSPTAVTPLLKAAGIPAIAVFLGDSSTSGQAQMQAIANGTGGSYAQVTSAAALPGLFLNVVLQSVGGGLLAQSPLSTIAANTTSESTVTVETGSATAFFQLGFLDAADMLGLQLVDPSGNTITCGAPPSGVTCDATDPNSVFFEVANPQAGDWKMQVTSGATITNNGEYQTAAGSTSDGTAVDAIFENDSVDYPAPIIVRAALKESGEGVMGAAVTAEVTRPDDSIVNITLYDDGNPANGDRVGDDGEYSARFNAYCNNCDGSYTFRINADGTGSGVETVAGEGLFAPLGIPRNTRAVTPFKRSTTVSAIVNNVPSSVPQADVSVAVSVSQTKTDTIYSLVVTNNGPDDAEDVNVKDFLAEELEFVSCTSSGSGTCTGEGEVDATIASLANGASETITLTTRRPCSGSAGTDLTNIAIASATTSDPDSSNNRGTNTVAATACSDCTVKDYTEDLAVVDDALAQLKKYANQSLRRAKKAGANVGTVGRAIKKFGKKNSTKLDIPMVITDCPDASCTSKSKTGSKDLFKALKVLRGRANKLLTLAQRAGVSKKKLKTLRSQIKDSFTAGNAFKGMIPENDCSE